MWFVYIFFFYRQSQERRTRQAKLLMSSTVRCIRTLAQTANMKPETLLRRCKLGIGSLTAKERWELLGAKTRHKYCAKVIRKERTSINKLVDNTCLAMLLGGVTYNQLDYIR